MTTRTLNLTPTAQGQATQFNAEVIRTELDGGAGRYRADVDGASRIVTLRFVLNADEYQYLTAFLAADSNAVNRGAAFFAPLYTDQSAPTTHTCRIIPGSLRLDAPSGGAYVVTLDVEAEQVARDGDYDTAILLLFETYDDPFAVLNLFDELANISLPGVGVTS